MAEPLGAAFERPAAGAAWRSGDLKPAGDPSGTAVASGRLDPSRLYTHRYPLEQLGEALDATRDRPGNFTKALVTF